VKNADRKSIKRRENKEKRAEKTAKDVQKKCIEQREFLPSSLRCCEIRKAGNRRERREKKI